jgi:hypothetical protein
MIFFLNMKTTSSLRAKQHVPLYDVNLDMDMDIAKGCKAICYGKKTKGREVRN